MFAKNSGYSDTPASTPQDDQFEVGAYIRSLSSFILSCDTPMTIAIQGDWGTGKTSIMNMLHHDLQDKVVSVMFNTWQFSQFGMESSLAVSLLSRLSSKLEADSTARRFAEATLKITKGVLLGAVRLGAESVIGDGNTERIDQIAQQSGFSDAAEHVETLRNEFAVAVEKKLAASGKQRIVLFIDDLDRLQPTRAVEMLEIIKNFLDIENCVFVLAIDYNVVVRGIKAKYGDQIGEAKGRSFFDKIIQLPFQIPIGHYNVVNYLKFLSEKASISADQDELNDIYLPLIAESIGRNPRAIKRLFNILTLTKIVSKERNVCDQASNAREIDRFLFATLCMQTAFPRLYDFVLRSAVRREGEGSDLETLINELSDDPSEENDSWECFSGYCEKHDEKLDEQDKRRISEFMETFKDAIDVNRDERLSGNEIELLASVLSLSKIVATNEGKSDAIQHQRLSASVKQKFAEALIKECNARKMGVDFIYDPDDDVVKAEIPDSKICYYSFGFARSSMSVRFSISGKNEAIRQEHLRKIKNLWPSLKSNMQSESGECWSESSDKATHLSSFELTGKRNNEALWPQYAKELAIAMEKLRTATTSIVSQFG